MIKDINDPETYPKHKTINGKRYERGHTVFELKLTAQFEANYIRSGNKLATAIQVRKPRGNKTGRWIVYARKP